MVALHAASSAQGAQLYVSLILGTVKGVNSDKVEFQIECAQINVTGGTGSASPTTYSIPGIYKATDPGLLINIYQMTSSSIYTIPGGLYPL
jgi:Auxiliary Activity family 9 (formerly GH61)